MNSQTRSQPEFNPPRDVEDPIPDPEPASPSLDEPDPGVFHHDPAQPFPPAP
jgi:hypothetical protein